MSKTEIYYSARLVIYGLSSYNKNEVKRTVKWLRCIADELEKEKDLKIYTINPIWKLIKYEHKHS